MRVLSSFKYLSALANTSCCQAPITSGRGKLSAFSRRRINMKYPKVTAGQTEACINRMGGWSNFLRYIGGQGKIVFNTILSIRGCYFSPEDFFGERGWKIVERDERSLVLTEIDLSNVLFETMLQEGETVITGEEKLKRLKASKCIRLDAKIFQTLWENQYFIPESWKEKVNGNTRYIFFDGTILRHPSGYRCVLFLCWDDGEWNWSHRWLNYNWGVSRSSAVLAK